MEMALTVVLKYFELSTFISQVQPNEVPRTRISATILPYRVALINDTGCNGKCLVNGLRQTVLGNGLMGFDRQTETVCRLSLPRSPSVMYLMTVAEEVMSSKRME